MSTLTRKQREVVEREARLLDVARRMLIEQGFDGLSLDKLAKATEYSKGTIYLHFKTKEDLVTAMALQSMAQRQALFAKAASFKGRPRERMCAIGVGDELFARLHPHYFRSELIIKMASLEDRASPERRAALDIVECGCFDTIIGVVHEAIEQKDLILPPGETASKVVFGVFAASIGTQMALLNFRPLLQKMEITDPLVCLRANIESILDGFGWKPLRSEWNYSQTFDRISREIFADEWKRVGLG